MAKAESKPRPDCWVGSDPAATAHVFDVHVQGEPPELLITFCTRCGHMAEVRESKETP